MIRSRREFPRRTCYAGAVGAARAVGRYLLTCDAGSPSGAQEYVSGGRKCSSATGCAGAIGAACAVGRDVMTAGAIGPWIA